MLNVSKTRRYAFVHIPRTSGVHTIESLERGGYHIINSWPNLKRDWTTMEMLQHLKNSSSDDKVVAHNHSLGWNEDLIDAAHYYGFVSFAIIRDPLEQYPSIYKRFFLGNVSWEGFLDDCLEGVQRYQFVVPSYYRQIKKLIPYNKNMGPVLERAFNIQENASRPNVSPESNFVPSNQDFDRIRKSDVYERYIECVEFMESKWQTSQNIENL